MSFISLLLFNIDQNTITHSPVVIVRVIGLFIGKKKKQQKHNNRGNPNEFVLIRLSLILLIKLQMRRKTKTSNKIMLIGHGGGGGAWKTYPCKIMMKMIFFTIEQ